MAKEKSRKRSASVKDYLEGLSHAELVSCVLELATRTPEAQRDLEHRAVLSNSDTGELLRETRKEVRSLASDRYWNDWEDRFDDADYSHLRKLFERLLAAGQADALLDLGRELLEKAGEHLEHSDSEELDQDLLACFATVFQAVPLSSRSDLDKLLYLIDLSLEDEYDLTEGMNFLFERDWPTAVWSAVADEMARRLESTPTTRTGLGANSFKRHQLYDWLGQALEASGREDEFLAILERDAAASGSYLELVDALIARKRWDDARRWILEGLQKKNLSPAWSGDTLRDRFRTVAEHQKDWAMVAALAADSFFDHPHSGTFRDLLKAAKKAGCEEPIRAAATSFLETGIRPDGKTQPSKKSPSRRIAKKEAATASVWPLPALPAGILRESRSSWSTPGPHYEVLLQLALEEKKPDEALRWYDRLSETRKGRKAMGYFWPDYRPQVADTVADSHPDRAVALYRDLIAGHLAVTKVSAYEAAKPYLVKLKALLTRNNRTDEWTHYLNGLRETHARKLRLIEVLDRVERGRSRR
jgi:uncharacterized Zn finger protein